MIRNLDVKGINSGAIFIQSECPMCGTFFYISKDVISQAGECPKCAQEMVFWASETEAPTTSEEAIAKIEENTSPTFSSVLPEEVCITANNENKKYFESKCRLCGTVFKAHEDWIDQKGECPGCGQEIVIAATCPSCHTSLAYNAKFCAECGTVIMRFCPHCKKQNEPNAKFCSECGTALWDNATPSTSKAVSREACQTKSSLKRSCSHFSTAHKNTSTNRTTSVSSPTQEAKQQLIPHNRLRDDRPKVSPPSGNSLVKSMPIMEILFSFRGRIPRSSFFAYIILVVLSIIFLGLLKEKEPHPILYFIGFIQLWIGLALQVKRYHDIGISGWWMWLSNMIPIIHLGFLISKGDAIPNKYGNLTRPLF